MIDLKKSALEIVKIFNQNNYLCLAVGGYVRDLLRNDEIFHDLDFVTDASVGKVLEILKEAQIKVLPLGMKYQTVCAFVDGKTFEISSFREGSRSLKEDAAHRDFTINALYQDLLSGEIFDPLNGQFDIHNKILRFVLSPEERIFEDPLRILRAYRFYSTLGYKFEESTLLACRKHSHLLAKKITPERIHSELLKLMEGKFYPDLFQNHFEVFSFLFPELHISDSLLFHPLNPFLRLACLFHNQNEKNVRIIVKRFLFSNEERNYLLFFVQGFLLLSSPCHLINVRRLINIAHQDFLVRAPEILQDFIFLCREFSPYVEFGRVLEDQNCFSPLGFFSPLSGHEIQQEFNLVQGLEIGKLKSFLQDKVEEGSLGVADKNEAYRLLHSIFDKV